MLANIARHFAVLRESLREDRARRAAALPLENEEFLPAALEVVEQPPNPLGRATLWTLVGFVIVALVWACVGQVDIVASAPGKIEPKGRVKIIQSADLGIVRAIHVSDGQAVEAGQPLLELNPTVSAAEVEQARQSLLTAEVDVARASALADFSNGGPGRFIAPRGMSPASVSLQVALVDARIRQQRAAIDGLRYDGTQRSSDVSMVGEEIVKLEAQLPLAQTQLDSLERLQAQGYAPRLRVDEVRERVVGMRQDLAIRREEYRRATAGRLGAGAELGRAESEFAREAFDALTEAQATRALRAEELKKAEEKARLTVLKAPEPGVVQQLQANTIGGVVEAAAPLMVLVPRRGELVLEARVLNRDVGFIRAGQAVEVKLEAYPFTRFGVVDGVVEHIARDAVEDEAEGLVYPARIRLVRPWISIAGVRTPLSPGMAATAEIKTGKRRIIEYLLSPLSRRAAEAGRER